MFIPQSADRRVMLDRPLLHGCTCAPLVDSYVSRGLPPETRTSFELHMLECSTCLMSVELERLLRRALREQKTRHGIPCATRLRRRR